MWNRHFAFSQKFMHRQSTASRQFIMEEKLISQIAFVKPVSGWFTGCPCGTNGTRCQSLLLTAKGYKNLIFYLVSEHRDRFAWGFRILLGTALMGA